MNPRVVGIYAPLFVGLLAVLRPRRRSVCGEGESTLRRMPRTTLAVVQCGGGGESVGLGGKLNGGSTRRRVARRILILSHLRPGDGGGRGGKRRCAQGAHFDGGRPARWRRRPLTSGVFCVLCGCVLVSNWVVRDKIAAIRFLKRAIAGGSRPVPGTVTVSRKPLLVHLIVARPVTRCF